MHNLKGRMNKSAQTFPFFRFKMILICCLLSCLIFYCARSKTKDLISKTFVFFFLDFNHL